MAINAYLQAAAGQLESAANALRKEMDQARADFMSFERQASHDLTNKESDMRAAVARAASAPEPGGVTFFTNQAAQLRGQIKDLKEQIETRRRQMEDQIRGKEGAIQGLMDQSRGLKNQASGM